MVVKFDRVIAHNDAHSWDVRKMADVLRRQGQIEPLQVRLYHPAITDEDSAGETFVVSESKFITHEQDVWAPAIVYAAKMLGWPTLLVHVTERYQE